MYKIYWLIVGLAYILVSIFTLTSKLPLTNREVREGYTAYSLIKTGKDTNGTKFPLLLKADGNYLSTFGTYSKVLSIKLFGLNSTGVRISGIIAGILSIIAFYFVLNKFIKNKFIIISSVILLTISPLFFSDIVFNSGVVYLFALALLLSGLYINADKQKRSLYIKIAAAVLVLAGIYIYKFERPYLNFLKRESIISDIVPSAYSFDIDKRLSYGLIYNSPLVTKHFNFTRIALNKFYYGINSIFKSLISPFDFERLFSPVQSQTVINKDGGIAKLFPAFYFWELPVIIAGFILFFKKEKSLIPMFVLGFIPLFFFKNDLTIFLLPFITVCESFFFFFLIQNFKKWKKVFYAGVIIILLISLLTYLDLFREHSRDWLSSDDVTQNEIWSSISAMDLSSNKIIVTDRFGEPVFYYLYYEKVDPNYYLMSKQNGPLINGEIQRVDNVGYVFFRSFNYESEPKVKNEIWIGSGMDFGEKTNELKIVKL